MPGYRVIRPGHTFILGYSMPSIPFRQKFYFTAASLLILGVDIALAYLIYRTALIFW